jgi:hypothetical protein
MWDTGSSTGDAEILTLAKEGTDVAEGHRATAAGNP